MGIFGQYERGLLWVLVYSAVYLATGHQNLIFRSIFSVSTANLAYLLLTWWAFRRLDALRLQTWASHPFPAFLERHPWLDFCLLGGRTGLSFVLSASVMGFLVASFYLPFRSAFKLTAPENVLFVVLCVLCAVTSWLMAHLAFALHYAFLYYRRGTGGLNFPGDETPDLMDFAYFAFTVGTTFAASDVEVARKDTRRFVLKHTLFSFAYNTAILALTLQFTAGGG